MLCGAGTYPNVCHMQKATLTLRAKRGSFEPCITALCLQANKDNFSGLLLFALPAISQSAGADNLNGLAAVLLQNHCHPVGCD